MSQKVNCPTCGKPIIWDKSSMYRPFCSERCKMIDLGEWADENHRIEGVEPPYYHNLDEDN